MARRLVVELDGGQHADATVKDQQRDAWLRSQGYIVLHFWNNEVMQQLEGVLELTVPRCGDVCAIHENCVEKNLSPQR